MPRFFEATEHKLWNKTSWNYYISIITITSIHQGRKVPRRYLEEWKNFGSNVIRGVKHEVVFHLRINLWSYRSLELKDYLGNIIGIVNMSFDSLISLCCQTVQKLSQQPARTWQAKGF